MAFPLIIFIGVAITATAIAIRFWDAIFERVRDSILPWVKEHLPEGFYETFRTAFNKIDGAVRTIRNAAREAFRAVRKFLIAAVEEIERVAPGKYTSKIKQYLKESETEVKVITTEETISLDDLPPEIRATIVMKESPPPTDLLKLREDMLEMEA